MARIHLIVHVMHELVPKSALIVLMGRHVKEYSEKPIPSPNSKLSNSVNI
jgi:hypothetical protein